MIAEHDLTTTNDCAYLADIEQIIQHPGYDPNEFDLDYSVLVLKRQVACSAYVSPICLPSMDDSDEMYENRNAVAIGWGTVNVDTGEMPDKLQHVKVKTMSNDECGYYDYDL